MAAPLRAAPLRGVLVGCGFFAVNQLHAWRDIEGVEIVGVCDRDPARLALVGDQFGIVRRYEDAADLLDRERPDFVDIATTLPSHRALVELAADRGVPAICQKPFAPTLADARAMVAACAHAGVPLMVHENFRWQTPIRAVRAAIEGGAIGTPFWGRASFRSGFDVFSGQPYLATQPRFIVEDLGIHTLDIARFLFGDATRLTARLTRVNPSIQGEDVATMLLDHAGATSMVDVSYATRLPSEPFPQTLVEVDGTEGTLRLTDGFRLVVHGRGGTAEHEVPPGVPAWGARPWNLIQESVVAIQRHWADALRAGAEPETSGRDNLATLALVEAAYRSAATGEAVDPATL